MVPRIDRSLLRIAVMLRIVPPRVAEVDPAHKGHVLLRLALPPDHEELLVMRPEPADPLIEQHLPAGLVDLRAQALVLLRVEREAVRMRPPEKTSHVDPGMGEVDQNLADGGAFRKQLFVPVAPPVGEINRSPFSRAQSSS